jgi:5-methylthioadenosine/S-adenosylhomocysteine deaminase
MARTLLKGGTVVTMDPALGNLASGDVLIDGDRIAAVGPSLSAGEDTEIVDATGMIVMPGLVNAHIHTWQTGLRGLAGDWTAANYVRAIHAGLATFFRPADIYIGNLVGALNQIDSGTTTIVDFHHNNPTPDHTDAAIDGLTEAGIRALFLHGSPKPDPKPGQKPYREIPMPRGEVERLRKGRFAADDGLVTLGLALLGPQAAVAEVVMQDFRLAREFDLVASMHHSNATQVAPTGYADTAAAGLVSARTNIVHGNQLTDADFGMLADHGATFVVTAEIEMQMAYGDPLTGRLLARGLPVSIGSDVECAYAPDMFAVMRTTMQAERYRAGMKQLSETGERPEAVPVTVRDALRWATRDNARMAGLDHAVGSLTPGKQADIVMLRRSDLGLTGVADPVAAVVMYGNTGHVDTVYIAGRAVKRNGALVYADLNARVAELAQSSARILGDFDTAMSAGPSAETAA